MLRGLHAGQLTAALQKEKRMAPTQTERQLNQARKVEDKEKVKTEDIMEDMEEVKTEDIMEDEEQDKEEDKTEVKMEDTMEDKEEDKMEVKMKLIIPQCGGGQFEGQARKVEDKVEDKVEQEEKDHCWSSSDVFHSRGQVANSRESFDWKVVEPYDGNFTFHILHFTFISIPADPF